MKKHFLLFQIMFLLCAITTKGQESFYFVRPEGEISAAYSEKKSIYEIHSSDENFTIPNTPFQCVRSVVKSNNGVNITVETGCFGNKETMLKRFLKDTRLLEISSEDIQRIARKFSKSRTKIHDVCNFVYNYISHKTDGIPLVSARTVLKTKTGDCTEHTVLTVAILRALGIPARAMVGVILTEQFGMFRDVFVFHMWAEAHDGEKWILADATRPKHVYPNRYIAFAEHSLKAEVPLEYLSAVSSIKNLKIRYAKNKGTFKN